MDKLVINGGTRLKGEVVISGAKNAAVALIPATLLIDGVCTISNIPAISDVKISCKILQELGAILTWNTPNEVTIDTRNITSANAPIDMTSKFRASYYLIGALLGRCKSATVGLPGGCNLGARPIDQHIKGFEALGAKVEVAQGKITATAKNLVGTSIYMDMVSVGATDLRAGAALIIAGIVAKGETSITNLVHIDRGYENIEEKFRGIGANIQRITEEDF